METAWLIYWYISIGNVLVLFAWLLWLSLVATIFLGVYFKDRFSGNNQELGEKFHKVFLKPLLPMTIMVLSIICFYPSKSDLAYIFGGAALVSVAQTEEAQKLPDNLLRAANAFLEGVDTEEEAE